MEVTSYIDKDFLKFLPELELADETSSHIIINSKFVIMTLFSRKERKNKSILV